jgi:Rhodopirellula transposase DDE domain
VHDEAQIEQIEEKYRFLSSLMDERMRRQWAGTEARALGWGGVAAVSQATGMSPNTIRKGLAELVVREKNPQAPVDARLRKEGGGRKRRSEADPGLLASLDGLVEPLSRGDPGSPLRWTCKSTTHLAEELGRLGHPLSPRTVGRLLNADGYSLQSNRKTKEGASHPDRNAQFEFINLKVQELQQRTQPVISIDTKKKELVGPFKNGGQEWQPKGKPEEVRVHDFLDKELGKAIPYGIYDLNENEGWVSVGIDHDTAQFAAAAIYRWSLLSKLEGLRANQW